MIRLQPIDAPPALAAPRPIAPDDEVALLAALKALADPTRLRIFRLIAAQPEPICACHIVDRFDLTQPTIAHHLKVLDGAGLISTTRRGVWAYYRIRPEGQRLIASIADTLFDT